MISRHAGRESRATGSLHGLRSTPQVLNKRCECAGVSLDSPVLLTSVLGRNASLVSAGRSFGWFGMSVWRLGSATMSWGQCQSRSERLTMHPSTSPG